MIRKYASKANSAGVVTAIVSVAIIVVLSCSFLINDSSGNPPVPSDSWTDEGNYDIGWYGADADVYCVSTAEELAGLAVLVNGGIGFSGKTINLVADTDLREHLWVPVGTYEKPFGGTFDGGNNRISWMFAISSTPSGDGVYAGFFGYCDGASIDGVIIASGKADAHSGSPDGLSFYAGGVAAYAVDSKISNCVNNAEVISSGNAAGPSGGGEVCAGGIVGRISGTDSGISQITDCRNEGNIRTLDSSSITTEGPASIALAGGIAARATGTGILNSVNTGNVTAVSENGSENANAGAGGIVGRTEAVEGGTPSIEGCSNFGNVSALDQPPDGSGSSLSLAGGIAARSIGCDIRSCFNAGETVSVSDNNGKNANAGAGGIVGRAESGNIGDCLNVGGVSASDLKPVTGTANCDAGGIAGQVIGSVAVSNSANLGSVSSDDGAVSSGNAGGIVGQVGIHDAESADLTVRSCYNGTFSPDTDAVIRGSSSAGGIVGYVPGLSFAQIDDCVNYIEVDGKDNSGGIIGISGNQTKVVSSFNTGTITNYGITENDGKKVFHAALIGWAPGYIGVNSTVLQNSYAVQYSDSDTVTLWYMWEYPQDVAADEDGKYWSEGSGSFDQLPGDVYEVYLVSEDFIKITRTVLQIGNTYGSGMGLGGGLPVPERTGYHPDGWHDEYSEQIGDDTVFSGSGIRLSSHMMPNSYTITFDSVSGEMTVTYDAAVGMLPVVTTAGYRFGGWQIDGVPINPSTVWKWTEDRQATAVFTAVAYALTFDSASDRIKVTYGSAVGPLPSVSKTGYAFCGWQIDGTSVDPSTVWMWTESRQATAVFTAVAYTLTFDPVSGSMTVVFDSPVGELPVPGKAGYRFDGWQIDGTPISSSTLWTYDSDKTAAAQWTPVLSESKAFVTASVTVLVILMLTALLMLFTLARRKRVTFESNGGSGVEDTIVPHNSGLDAPPDPMRAGYSFDGWFKDPGLTEEWDFDSDRVGEDIVLHAKWTAGEY